MSERPVIIIGSGPAGLTAALYAARANLTPLVIEGIEAGGQLMLTTMVENWPGYRDGIMGPDLMTELRAQAARFGAEIIQGDVSSVDLSKRPFTVTMGQTQYLAQTVIVATGASAKWLDLGVDKKLSGRGVSTCATCDGFFFKGRPVAVIGGGDTAMEEAIYLSKLATSVTVVHRRDSLRASKVMQDKAMSMPNVSFIWNTEVVDIKDLDKGVVTSLVLKNTQTGVSSELAVDGVFIGIGHVPNTALFKGQLALHDNGYLKTHEGSRTSVAGVFAAGDVQDHIYRQAVTAAGSGCMAAIDAERFLSGTLHQAAAAHV
ncbi:MAG: thioredoxin-disulfide reductase [Acidobacterium sp.]|nr:thioredoxin-disulfide reductase [Acidobacteriota bacterium]PHY11381.1 MAG: thioredoxin-disulfide reductase [Acidobacterium sp.]